MIVILPGREKREEVKAGEKAKGTWNEKPYEERKKRCEEVDYFDAESIERLLKKIIRPPENKGAGPESHNNDLGDFVKKI